MSEDLTVAILIEIRDEIRSTNHRVDQTNVRLDDLRGDLRTGLAEVRGELRTGLAEVRDEIRSTNHRVDQTNVRLDDLRGELRTGLTDVRGELRELRTDVNAGAAEVHREIALVRGEARDELREWGLRIATRVTEQTAATRDLYTMLTTQLELRDRVTQCEHEIGEIKRTLKKPNGSG